MRRWWILWLFCMLAPAHAQEAVLTTRPTAATIIDLDGGQQVAAASDNPKRFTPQGRGLHRYRVMDPPFDSLDVTLQWDDTLRQWAFRAGSTGGHLPFFFSLSRTVVLNVDPPDALPYQGAPPSGTSTASDQTVSLAGSQPIPVVPLPRTAAGATVIPNADAPRPIYLKVRGFEDWSVQFRPGELSGQGPFPATLVHMRPLYGPFSYRWFDIALSIGALTAVAAWLLVLQPKRRRAALQQQRLQDATRAVRGGKDDDAPLSGKKLITDGGDPFLLLGPLGRGGMAVVYEAMPAPESSRSAQERWAAKVLLDTNWDDRVFRDRFTREVRICSRLQHPGIVKVLDWGVAQLSLDGQEPETHPFMIMEVLQGESLDVVLKRGPLPPHQAVAWTLAGLRALATAHAAGVIHRDLKPSNIFITPSGNVKLIDFGIARETAGMTLTPSFAQMGTPGYMSPEQIDNSKAVTVRSDIYSFGVVLYRMVTGQAPFEGDNMWALFTKVLTVDPPLPNAVNPSVPDALSRVVMQMMAREPEQRFGSAEEAIHALEITAALLPR